MKTLIELISDTIDIKKELEKINSCVETDNKMSDIIKKVESLQNSLQEMNAATQDKSDTIDMDLLVLRTSSQAINNHILTSTQDMFVQESYLVLMLSVAVIDTDLSQDNLDMCTHVCRIASSFKNIPDMNLLLKKAVTLTEKAIYEYLKAIKDNMLDDAFIVDCLLTHYLYDSENKGRLEYIANFAEIMGWEKVAVDEAMIIVNTIVEHKNSICGKFEYVDANKLRFYLRNCQKFIVELPNCFICDNSELVDVTEDLKPFAELKDKQSAYFHNVKVHKGSVRFDIKNIDKVVIDSCIFEETSSWLFGFKNVKEISITKCKFVDIIDSFDEFFGSMTTKYTPSGIIGNLENVEKLEVNSSQFRNCYIKIAPVAYWPKDNIMSWGKYSPQLYKDVLFLA